jgi:hypothetical protein
MKLNGKMVMFIIAGLLLFVILLVMIIFNRKDGNLELIVLPDDAKITIDGKRRKPGKINLGTGKHEIVMSRDGFEEKRETFEIKANETRKLSYLMKANSVAGTDWLRDNQAKIVESEVLDPVTTTGAGGVIQDKYPVVKRLPFIDPRFRIDYGTASKDNAEIIIYIRANTPERRRIALSLFQFWVGDISDYNIVFISKDTTGE